MVNRIWLSIMIWIGRKFFDVVDVTVSPDGLTVDGIMFARLAKGLPPEKRPAK